MLRIHVKDLQVKFKWLVVLGMILPLLGFRYFGFELSKILYLSFLVSVSIVLTWFGRNNLMKVDKMTIWLWLGLIGGMFLVSVGRLDGVQYLWGEPGRWQGLWFFSLLFFMYIELIALSKGDLIKQVGMAWLGGALGTVVIGLGQKIKVGLGLYALEYAGRTISSVGQPNFWADYLLVGWVLVWFSNRFSKKIRWLSLVVTVVGLWLSGSRLTMMVFIALVLFLLLRFLRAEVRKVVRVLLSVGIGLSLVFSVSMGWWAARLLIWERVVEKIRFKPWFGYGLGNLYDVIETVGFLRTDRAHNVLLDMWLIGGVGLLLIFIGLWARGVWLAYKNRRKEVLLALVVWLVLGSIHVLGVLNWIWLVVLLSLNGKSGGGHKRYSMGQVLLGVLYGLVVLFGVLRGYSLV